MTYLKAADEAAPKCAQSPDIAQAGGGSVPLAAVVSAALGDVLLLARLEARSRGVCDHCSQPGRLTADHVGQRIHLGKLCPAHRARVPRESVALHELVEEAVRIGKAHRIDRVLAKRGVAPYARNPSAFEIIEGTPPDAIILVARLDGAPRVVQLRATSVLSGVELWEVLPRPALGEIDRGQTMRHWAHAAALGHCERRTLAVIGKEGDE